MPSLEEFFIEGSDPTSSHVLLSISEPKPGESHKGVLFMIGEIYGGSDAYIARIQQMFADIESGYFETDKRKGASPFELTLQHMNHRSDHLLPPASVSLDVFVGVVLHNDIEFALYGRPFAAMIITKGEARKHIDLTEQYDMEKGQLFPSVTSGNITMNDFIVIGTRSVPESISLAMLKDYTEHMDARDMSREMHEQLQNASLPDTAAGIVIHRPGKKQQTRNAEEQDGSSDSLKKLVSAQAATSRVLSPGLLTSLRGAVSAVRAQEKPQTNKVRKKEHTSRRSARGQKENVWLLFVRALGIGAVSIGRATGRAITAFGRGTASLFLLITNHGNQRELVLSQWREWLHAKRSMVSSLPLLSKILFVCTLILAIMFVGSIGTVRYKERQAQQSQHMFELVRAIEDKRDAAESRLIYGDEEAARTFVQEAKLLLKELSKEEYDSETFTALSSSVDEMSRTLRKIEIIEPDVLLDLHVSFPDARVNQMAKIGSSIVFYGTDDSSVYIYNILTQSIEAAEQQNISRIAAGSTPKEDDEIVFVTANGLAASFDPENRTLSTIPLDFPHDAPSVTDVFVYNTHLYTLDAGEAQIFKHNRTQQGFAKGVAWVQEDGGVAGGRSLSIDGDIFVLTSQSIFKFERGLQQTFSLQELDPPLDSASTIWTYNDVESLYVLEPTHRRVIQLLKDGSLVRQYTAAQWSAPSDMIVDMVDRVIYVFDGGTLTSFNI
jgi:hypothetical protein